MIVDPKVQWLGDSKVPATFLLSVMPEWTRPLKEAVALVPFKCWWCGKSRANVHISVEGYQCYVHVGCFAEINLQLAEKAGIRR